jgi:hypothetical protein
MNYTKEQVAESEKAYWLKQAAKHERTAATLRTKYRNTLSEFRSSGWLKQAATNERPAAGIRFNYK